MTDQERAQAQVTLEAERVILAERLRVLAERIKATIERYRP